MVGHDFSKQAPMEFVKIIRFHTNQINWTLVLNVPGSGSRPLLWKCFKRVCIGPQYGGVRDNTHHLGDNYWFSTKVLSKCFKENQHGSKARWRSWAPSPLTSSSAKNQYLVRTSVHSNLIKFPSRNPKMSWVQNLVRDLDLKPPNSKELVQVSVCAKFEETELRWSWIMLASLGQMDSLKTSRLWPQLLQVEQHQKTMMFPKILLNCWETSISDEQCSSYSVVVIMTILLHPLSFSPPPLIWLKLVISYISRRAFQPSPEKSLTRLVGLALHSAVAYGSISGYGRWGYSEYIKVVFCCCRCCWEHCAISSEHRVSCCRTAYWSSVATYWGNYYCSLDNNGFLTV